MSEDPAHSGDTALVTPPRRPVAAAAACEGTLAGWGRIGVPGQEVVGESLVALAANRPLSRGLGRSYGDSSLPAPGDCEVVGTRFADRILGFDAETGVLRAEAGLSLARMNEVFLPRGFFTPVTPGTQYVTLGGMVAADVHGKNHHVDGCIGGHVRRLRVMLADGQVVECTPSNDDPHADLFWATVGGMGLTGHILEVELQLKAVPSPWIYQESERVSDIDAFVGALKSSSAEWPFTVGWIDCLKQGPSMGRGILYKGRWAAPNEAPARPPRLAPTVTVPFECPQWVLGPASIRLFNEVLYRAHWQRKRQGLCGWEKFFYPLDKIKHWNRAYGRAGLTQYQCVLPDEAGPGAARRFLEVLTQQGGASFLCVIKDCGPEGKGLLSFLKPGISVALDIAVRPGTQAVIDALNEHVLAEGGRIYLAKDGFTRPEHFRAMEQDRLAAFEAVRRRYDPDQRLRSAQSVRILGDRGA